MLHNKFYDNRPTGSGAEMFEGFLPYMACDQTHIGHVTKLILITFHFLVFKFSYEISYKRFWEQQILIFIFEWPRALNTPEVSFTHLAHCIYQCSDHRLQ